MRNQSSMPCAARDRCVFSSVLMLGALFALSASPCARVPLISALVIMGVPLMTFGVAAPSRLGLFRELALHLREGEATLLWGLLRLVRRKADAATVWQRHRARVEGAYMMSADRIGEIARTDPDRLHHARRLAGLAAGLVVLAGIGLPLMHPSVYTFGDWPQAPLVIALDLLVFGVVGGVVSERVTLRLLEASDALRAGDMWTSRARALPVTMLLGAALGMVATFIVVDFGALACAVETSWIVDTSFWEPTRWFIQATTPVALPLGVGIGTILGAGVALAQPPDGMLDEGEVSEEE
jgi:hypothetical protein